MPPRRAGGRGRARLALFWASEDRDLRETAYSSFAVLEVLEVGSGTPHAGPFGGVTVS